jgi:hypothetical protein
MGKRGPLPVPHAWLFSGSSQSRLAASTRPRTRGLHEKALKQSKTAPFVPY